MNALEAIEKAKVEINMRNPQGLMYIYSLLNTARDAILFEKSVSSKKPKIDDCDEYSDWQSALVEQENLMTADEHISALDAQDHEEERNHVYHAGHPA